VRASRCVTQLELVARRACLPFTISVPRNKAMWKALARIPTDAWQDALDMEGARVATYTPMGRRHEPLRMIVRRRFQ